MIFQNPRKNKKFMKIHKIQEETCEKYEGKRIAFSFSICIMKNKV